jgi:hypothetical protein
MTIITIKLKELRELCKKYNDGKRIQWDDVYRELGISLDLLDRPYAYMWLKNLGEDSEKVIYVGATEGDKGKNKNRRGVAIINHILGGSHTHSIKSCENSSLEFSDEDTLTIILIPTKGKNEAFLLERALLVCLEEEAVCNKI